MLSVAFFVFMRIVIKLSVIMLSVVMISVIMLSVVILIVIYAECGNYGHAQLCSIRRLL